MLDRDGLVLMGVVGTPHGVKGQVRVKSYTGDPLAIGDYGPLVTKDGRVLNVSHVQPSKNVVVVTFKQVRFRDEAEALKGTELFVKRDQLPDGELEEDEFFIDDLIGMAVVAEDGTTFGTVQDVPNFGAGDLVEVKLTGSPKTELFSFEMAVFPNIDFEKRIMVIVPPGEIIVQQESGEKGS
ncbi:MAG: ribosome maturation factor RimM [Pseudomonadota bacterium]